MVRKSASGRTLLENTYDLNGNRVGLKDYSGKETVYTYDALDRISKVTDKEAKAAYMIPMPELIKTYDLEGKSEAEIWDIIFEGFVLNGKINSIRCYTLEEEYDKEYVKAYMEREGKYIQNVFVVLSGSVRKEDNGPLSISLFGNGACNMNSYYQYDEKAEKLLAAVSDKYHENGVANTFDYCFKIEDYEAADSLANYYGMCHFDDDSIIDQCEEK